MANDPMVSKFFIESESLTNKLRDLIIRLLLNYSINAIIQITTDQIQIIGLENADNPDDNISFISDTLPSIKVRAKILQDPDWNLYRQMYVALKNETPTILDPMQDKLINQLIDLDMAKRIQEDHSLTFEGDILIEIESSDEEYEENEDIRTRFLIS